MVKIIWVQDDFEGPLNGLAEHKGEKVWFARKNNPLIVSSTNVPVPNVEHDNKERTYILYRLSDDDMMLVTKNHEEYCKETGAPLLHGDPIKIKHKEKSDKTNIKKYNHKIIPSRISGDIIGTIDEKEFENYHVPRRFEHM